MPDTPKDSGSVAKQFDVGGLSQPREWTADERAYLRARAFFGEEVSDLAPRERTQEEKDELRRHAMTTLMEEDCERDNQQPKNSKKFCCNICKENPV
jgi:hypothetical protein